MSAIGALNFVPLCGIDDLWVGDMESFAVGTREVLLVNIDGEFHAYDGACPHQGMPLVEGQLEGRALTCRAHRWSFDAASGASINPHGKCLHRFMLRIENGQVWVADPACGA